LELYEHLLYFPAGRKNQQAGFRWSSWPGAPRLTKLKLAKSVYNQTTDQVGRLA